VTVVGEIVGPPGSGKSTLNAALARQGVRTSGTYLSTRRAPWWAAATASSLTVLREASRGGLGWRELRWIVRLEATPRILDVELARERAIVFDQGPVFALVRMRERLGEAPGFDRTRAWWATQLTRWSDRLDLVASVDADDRTLLERIRAREKDHEIRSLDDETALRALADERAAYRAVLDRLAEGACRVVHVDTATTDVDTAVARIASDLGAETRR
jgi:adenylate kinase family enzyme